MSERFIDGSGVGFNQYRGLLPPSVHDWPFPIRVRDKELMAQLHVEWDHCQVCGKRGGNEIHHVTAGSKGKSDERCCCISLCRFHHDWVKTKKLPQGLILWMMWKTNQPNTDWVRLALLSRHFLEDLIVDQSQFERYKAERLKAKRIW
jgi:hypothetical protein